MQHLSFLVPGDSKSQVAGQESVHGGECQLLKLHVNMKILMRYVLAWMGAAGIMNVYFSRSLTHLSWTTFENQPLSLCLGLT